MDQVIRSMGRWPRCRCLTWIRPQKAALILSLQQISQFPQCRNSKVLSTSYIACRSYAGRTRRPSRRITCLASARPNAEVTKSRNQMKREAQHSIDWAIDLTTFSPQMIKKILSAVSLEDDVFEAIMLAKRPGTDVVNSRKRQLRYIGKLLRKADVEPRLMDNLMQAVKQRDEYTFTKLCEIDAKMSGDNGDVADTVEPKKEIQEADAYLEKATRWFGGLMSKDVQITKEIYSIRDVDFDRQELRKLIKNVFSLQDEQETGRDIQGALSGAKRSLLVFLNSVSRKMSVSE